MTISYRPSLQLRDAGNLVGADAWVLASDAPSSERDRAALARALYGDLVGICDGTDDQVEIKAAYAAGAKKVQLSRGTFVVTPDSSGEAFIVNSDETLAGMGMGATVIKAADGSPTDNRTIITLQGGGTVRDLTIDGNGINGNIADGGEQTNQHAIFKQGGAVQSGQTVLRVEVKNTWYFPIWLSNGASDSLIEGCKVHNNGLGGIRVQGDRGGIGVSENVRILGNLVRDNSGASDTTPINGDAILVLDSDRVTVQGNISENNQGDAYSFDDCGDLVVQGNVGQNCTVSGCSIESMQNRPVVSGNTFTDNSSWGVSLNAGGYENVPYFGANDLRGNSSGTVRINGDVSIPAGETLWLPAGTDNSANKITLNGDGASLICENGCSIGQVALEGDNTVFDGGGWKTLVDSTQTSGKGSAVILGDGGTTTFNHQTVKNASVKTRSGQGSQDMGVDGDRVLDALVEHIRVVDADRWGIRGTQTSGNGGRWRVLDCLIEDCDEDAIFMDNMDNSRVMGNQVLGTSDAGSDGIVTDATVVIIMGNIINGVQDQDINLLSGSEDCVAVGNHAANVTDSGTTNQVANNSG